LALEGWIGCRVPVLNPPKAAPLDKRVAAPQSIVATPSRAMPTLTLGAKILPAIGDPALGPNLLVVRAVTPRGYKCNLCQVWHGLQLAP
jgi:hypothetical protein